MSCESLVWTLSHSGLFYLQRHEQIKSLLLIFCFLCVPPSSTGCLILTKRNLSLSLKKNQTFQPHAGMLNVEEFQLQSKDWCWTWGPVSAVRKQTSRKASYMQWLFWDKKDELQQHLAVMKQLVCLSASESRLRVGKTCRREKGGDSCETACDFRCFLRFSECSVSRALQGMSQLVSGWADLRHSPLTGLRRPRLCKGVTLVYWSSVWWSEWAGKLWNVMWKSNQKHLLQTRFFCVEQLKLAFWPGLKRFIQLIMIIEIIVI